MKVLERLNSFRLARLHCNQVQSIYKFKKCIFYYQGNWKALEDQMGTRCFQYSPDDDGLTANKACKMPEIFSL